LSVGCRGPVYCHVPATYSVLHCVCCCVVTLCCCVVVLCQYLCDVSSCSISIIHSPGRCRHHCRAYPLESLLASASHTADPLDYHLSWHLMQTLTALGYTHVGTWQRDAAHSRYSEQLESIGLWHWAAFPLLHIESPQL